MKILALVSIPADRSSGAIAKVADVDGGATNAATRVTANAARITAGALAAGSKAGTTIFH